MFLCKEGQTSFIHKLTIQAKKKGTGKIKGNRQKGGYIYELPDHSSHAQVYIQPSPLFIQETLPLNQTRRDRQTPPREASRELHVLVIFFLTR